MVRLILEGIIATASSSCIFSESLSFIFKELSEVRRLVSYDALMSMYSRTYESLLLFSPILIINYHIARISMATHIRVWIMNVITSSTINIIVMTIIVVITLISE